MTQPDAATLAACPFGCGASYLNQGHDIVDGDTRYTVWCNYCGMTGPHEATEAEAITAWNTRTPPVNATLSDTVSAALTKSGTEIVVRSTAGPMDGQAFDAFVAALRVPSVNAGQTIAEDVADELRGMLWSEPSSPAGFNALGRWLDRNGGRILAALDAIRARAALNGEAPNG